MSKLRRDVCCNEDQIRTKSASSNFNSFSAGFIAVFIAAVMLRSPNTHQEPGLRYVKSVEVLSMLNHSPQKKLLLEKH